MAEGKSLSRRVTAIDVAKAAGVSQATVSYVLNRSPHHTIPEETRNRVVQAAADLRYTPHSAARTLRMGRSDNILMLTANWPTGGATAELFDLMTDEFQKRGLTLVTRRMREDQSVASAWLDLAPAAVILLAAIPDQDIKAMHEAGIFVTRAALSKEDSGSIVIPQERIGALQALHLVARGHRHIGYAGNVDARIAAFRNLRLKGATEVCRAAGIDDPVAINFPLNLEEAVGALASWTARSPKITAVCAYNDEHAFALLAAARELNLKVPQELAVIGVADLKIAQFAEPPLSTIRLNEPRLAQGIAEAVSRGISEKEPSKVYLDTFDLVVRKST